MLLLLSGEVGLDQNQIFVFSKIMLNDLNIAVCLPVLASAITIEYTAENFVTMDDEVHYLT